MPASITTPRVSYWKCLSCGKKAHRFLWPVVTLGDVGGEARPEYKDAYAKLGLTVAEASADPDRRRIDGSILEASGISGIATGGCSVFFCKTGAALMIGNMANLTVIPYEQMTVLRFGGRGAVVTTSDGGWMGGGFGLTGALEGALMADVLNALTTKTQTNVETLISFGWKQSELVLLNTKFTPQALASFLAPVLARIEASAPSLTRPSSSSEPDVVARLQQLADLHARGVLNDAEFSAAKERVLQIDP